MFNQYNIFSKESIGSNELILNSIHKESKTIDELKSIINNNKVDILEKLSVMELQGKIKIFQGKVQGIV